MRLKPMPPTADGPVRRYWIASYPKSGNTWFRGFLSAITGEGQPLDINRLAVPFIASSRAWLDDVLGFDTSDLGPDELDVLRHDAYAWGSGDKDDVFCKVHDAFQTRAGKAIFPGSHSAGALYIVRNPLDVAASYANHNGTDIDEAIACMGDPQHGLNTFSARIVPQARQHLGSWSDHVRGWIDATTIPVMTIRYEDMHRQPVATFARAARFLGLPEDEERVRMACEASSFGEMQRLERENGFGERPPGAEVFFRRGQVGGWRTELSGAQVSRVVADHGEIMRRMGYLDDRGGPLDG